MPLYLARGPSTFAYLIRARDRDHVNYIIDAVHDPGLFQVEVYEGPLNLTLSLPAQLGGDTDFADPHPDLNVEFTGSTEREQLLALPTPRPLDEFDEEWAHLRRCAFPHFAAAVEHFDETTDDTDQPAESPREDLEAAIARDVIEQGRHSLHAHAPASDEDEAEKRQKLGVSVPANSLLAGRAAHVKWSNADWGDEPTADPGSPDHLQQQLDRAIDRYGEVNLSFTADGPRWRIGRPAIAEGATLPEAIANAQKHGSTMEH